MKNKIKKLEFETFKMCLYYLERNEDSIRQDFPIGFKIELKKTKNRRTERTIWQIKITEEN